MSEKTIMNELPNPLSKKMVYNNEFGSREVWTNGKTLNSFTFPKKYEDIESFYFYSEYLKEAEDYIW